MLLPLEAEKRLLEAAFQIIGHPGLMPEVLSEIDVNYFLLKRLLGVKNQEKIVDGEKKSVNNKIAGLKPSEVLMINVGSQSLAGTVITVKKDTVRIKF